MRSNNSFVVLFPLYTRVMCRGGHQPPATRHPASHTFLTHFSLHVLCRVLTLSIQNYQFLATAKPLHDLYAQYSDINTSSVACSFYSFYLIALCSEYNGLVFKLKIDNFNCEDKNSIKGFLFSKSIMMTE